MLAVPFVPIHFRRALVFWTGWSGRGLCWHALAKRPSVWRGRCWPDFVPLHPVFVWCIVCVCVPLCPACGLLCAHCAPCCLTCVCDVHALVAHLCVVVLLCSYTPFRRLGWFFLAGGVALCGCVSWCVMPGPVITCGLMLFYVASFCAWRVFWFVVSRSFCVALCSALLRGVVSRCVLVRPAGVYCVW